VWELIVEAVAKVLGWVGLDHLIHRDEAKPDPRNFPPPR
jgi:hypothetical protein